MLLIKAIQSWLLDFHFCPHAFLQVYCKIFIIWQFALHGFSYIHKISSDKVFELFLKNEYWKMASHLQSYYFENLETGI